MLMEEQKYKAWGSLFLCMFLGGFLCAVVVVCIENVNKQPAGVIADAFVMICVLGFLLLLCFVSVFNPYVDLGWWSDGLPARRMIDVKGDE